MQAKENSSKYTGVSSDESRMGGFGSSNSGFSSSSSMGGGSALSKLELGSNKPKGSSLSGFGNSDSLRSSRYDDDMDVGHQAVSADDMDEDLKARADTGQAPSHLLAHERLSTERRSVMQQLEEQQKEETLHDKL